MRTLGWTMMALLIATAACDDNKAGATGSGSAVTAEEGTKKGEPAGGKAAAGDGSAKATGESAADGDKAAVKGKDGTTVEAKGKDEGEVKTGGVTAHGKGTEGKVTGGGVEAKGNMKGGTVKSGGVTVDTKGVTLPGGGRVGVP